MNITEAHLIVAVIVQNITELLTTKPTAIDTTRTTLQLCPVIDLLLRIILLSAALKRIISLLSVYI